MKCDMDELDDSRRWTSESEELIKKVMHEVLEELNEPVMKELWLAAKMDYIVGIKVSKPIKFTAI